MRLKRPDEDLFYQLFFRGIPYTFHRADGFYSLTLESDSAAIANAKCNPGTLKVVNEQTGDLVFESNERH